MKTCNLTPAKTVLSTVCVNVTLSTYMTAKFRNQTGSYVATNSFQALSTMVNHTNVSQNTLESLYASITLESFSEVCLSLSLLQATSLIPSFMGRLEHT